MVDKNSKPNWSQHVTNYANQAQTHAITGTPQSARKNAFKVMSTITSGGGYKKNGERISKQDAPYTIRNTGPTKAEWVQIVDAITKSALAFDMDDRVTRLYEFIQGDKDASDKVKKQSRAVSVIYWAARYVMLGGKNMTLNDYVRQSMKTDEELTDESIQGYIQRHGMNFRNLVETHNPIKIKKGDSITNDLLTNTWGVKKPITHISTSIIQGVKNDVQSIINASSDKARRDAIGNLQINLVISEPFVTQNVLKNDIKPIIPNVVANNAERILRAHNQPHILTSRIQKIRYQSSHFIKRFFQHQRRYSPHLFAVLNDLNISFLNSSQENYTHTLQTLSEEMKALFNYAKQFQPQKETPLNTKRKVELKEVADKNQKNKGLKL